MWNKLTITATTINLGFDQTMKVKLQCSISYDLLQWYNYCNR